MSAFFFHRSNGAFFGKIKKNGGDNPLRQASQNTQHFHVAKTKGITVLKNSDALSCSIGRLAGGASADYIFSGASTPMRRRPFFSTMRVQSASFKRAAAICASSPLMRQAE